MTKPEVVAREAVERWKLECGQAPQWRAGEVVIGYRDVLEAQFSAALTQRDQAHAAVWRGCDEERVGYLERAERAEAALAAERERADTLEAKVTHLGGACDYSAKVAAVWKLHDKAVERADAAEAALAAERGKHVAEIMGLQDGAAYRDALAAQQRAERRVGRLATAIRKHLTMADNDGLLEEDWDALRAALREAGEGE
jgi:hypothetical protein